MAIFCEETGIRLAPPKGTEEDALAAYRAAHNGAVPSHVSVDPENGWEELEVDALAGFPPAPPPPPVAASVPDRVADAVLALAEMLDLAEDEDEDWGDDEDEDFDEDEPAPVSGFDVADVIEAAADAAEEKAEDAVPEAVPTDPDADSGE